MENLNFEADSIKDVANPTHKKLPQMVHVDGEGLTFNDKLTMEVVPDAIELIVDYDALMNQTGIMCAKL